MKMEKTLENLKEYLERMNRSMSEIFDNIEDFKSDDEGIAFVESIMDKEIPEDLSEELLNSMNSGIFRSYAIRYMGYAIITKKFTRGLAKYIGDKKCLEIMAGQGCLSKSLQDEGVDIIVTDNYSWNGSFNMNDTWIDVEDMDCLEAIRKYGKEVSYILCSWIPYKSQIGYEALKLMNEINPECKMIVLGEGLGGCTADDLFFQHLERVDEDEEFLNHFRKWGGIYDYASIVKFRG